MSSRLDIRTLASLVGHASRVVERLPDLARDYSYALWHVAAQLVRQPGKARGEQTVLLLPGVYETPGFLAPLRIALEQAGNTVHGADALRLVVPEPARLVSVVARQLERDDLTDVVCVAHSKGGLLAKQLMLDPQTRERVTGAVCLCTPFGGSALGHLFLPRFGLRELVPGAPTIQSLAAAADVNARIVSIYPRLDPHIPQGSRLPGAENIQLPGFGHFGVLSDPRFLEATVAAVDRLRARASEIALP